MSTPQNLKLAFVIEAIDRATGTVTRINQAIDKVTEPIRNVRAAMDRLMLASRFDRVRGAWADLGNRGQALLGWGRNVAGMLFGLGTAAAAAGFAFKRVSDEVDRISDTAQSLGMTTQQFQRMGYAAQLSGSNSEEMAQALVFLNKNMGEARMGSKEALVNFARVGITLADLKNPAFNAGAAFERIADTYMRVGDEGNNAGKKIEVSTALLGRAGFRQIQFLNAGSAAMRAMYTEADRLGVTLSDSTVKNMTAFNDSFDRLRMTVFGAIANALGPLAPKLTAVVESIVEWTAANRELISSRFGEFVDAVKEKLPGFLDSLKQIAKAIGTLIAIADNVAQAMGGWGTVIYGVAAIIVGQGLVALWGLTTAVWGFGAALWATPIGWMIAGVSAIALAAGLVLKHWEPIKAFFEGVWNVMKRVLGGFGSPGAGNFHPTPFVPGLSLALAKPAAAAPSNVGTFGRNDLGGSLRIYVDADGKPQVVAKKNPGSVLDLDLDQSGGLVMGQY